MKGSIQKFSLKDESHKNEKHADGIENRHEKFKKLAHGNENKKCENLLLGLKMYSV